MAVRNLSDKVNAIEQSISSFQQLFDDVSLLRSSAGLTAHLKDLESRSRRNNLTLYGFADSESECWAISEKKILYAYAEHLHITVAPSEIETVHLLGRF